ncbi:metal ABC transporter permease [Candidatus Gracilibacteria bacterium]|nr:metal ABC transporter permease [Candidatus Gracilibacteria bacterium]
MEATFLQTLMYPFIWRALLAGGLMAVLTSQIGIFVLSKKLAFLGDTLSHAAFTGIALGLVVGLNPQVTVFAIAVLIAIVLTWLQNNSKLSSDTYIAILYATLLSLGIMIMSRLQGYRTELFQYLFGDILSISLHDIITISLVTILTLALLAWRYRILVMIIVDQDIAKTRGIAVQKYNYLFVLLLALTTAVTIKMIGVLLLSSLLVLPSASSLLISKSMRQSFIWSFVLSEIMIVSGLLLSIFWDTPSGPTIIFIGSVIFLILNIWRRR